MFAAIGMVFGKTGSKEPAYNVLKKFSAFEIRSYPAYCVAEVNLGESENTSDGFRILANYIGVRGTPGNKGVQNAPQNIAMTAPVLTSENNQPQPIAMTAPVLTGESQQNKKMAFALPFEYQNIADVPVPNDERIEIVQIPEKIVSCNVFSGSVSKSDEMDKLDEQRKALTSEGLLIGDGSDLTSPAMKEHQLAQYHPPFTIPMFRRNEIWIEMRRDNQKIKDLK